MAGLISMVPSRVAAAGLREVAATGVLAVVIAVAAVISDSRQWQPTTLVVSLAIVMVLADVVVVPSRKLRVSPGLMVQTTIMALLGPSPAVAISVLSIFVIDGVVYRVGATKTLMNVMTAAVLGLTGGVVFDAVREALDLRMADAAYAASVLPVYGVLAGLNLAVIGAFHPLLQAGERTRLFRQSGLPTLSLELLNGILAATAVLLWAHRGYIAAAGLLAVVVCLIPLTRSVVGGVRSSDDLATLRKVSDARAAEVARLASDRERLLSEVLDAEERERARLAESLHDGPLQRLMALRQDAAEADAKTLTMIDGLSAAISETRAIISSLHPATARELGIEELLRTAIAPFPTSRTVSLQVHSTVDERTVAATLPHRIAQELVVNAVKHARPRRIDVLVTTEHGHLVLEVNDDGVGIDTADSSRAVQAGHIGLAMVRRRVEDAGGRFAIETRRDGGTRSRVVLPLRAN